MFSSDSSSWSAGRGSLVVHVEPGRGDRARPQCLDQRPLVDDRSARGVDQRRGRLHQRELGGAEQAAGAVAEHEVDRQHVGALEQLLLGDLARTPNSAPRSSVRFSLQAITSIPNTRAGATIAPPSRPRPASPSVAPPRLRRQVELPVTVAQRAVLDRDPLAHGEDQRPRHLDRARQSMGRAAGHPGSRHRHAALAQMLRRRARRCASPWSPPAASLGSRSSTSRGNAVRSRISTSDLESAERVDQRLLGNRPPEERDLGVAAQRIPVGELVRPTLIVVEDRHAQHPTSIAVRRLSGRAGTR